jgi:hypothetical protein
MGGPYEFKGPQLSVLGGNLKVCRAGVNLMKTFVDESGIEFQV